MTDTTMPPSAETPVESILRDELAHGDVILGTIGPILGHLLANHDHSLFSDEIVARVRGMITSIAKQLLETHATLADEGDSFGFVERNAGELAGIIARDPGFLLHCHALAIETQLAERLHRRNAIDPSLSPLVQSLIASDDADTAAKAMAALTAQARFIQQQKRMHLPLAELPADQFHHALQSWKDFAGGLEDAFVAQVETAIRKSFDEAESRLGLMARIVEGLGSGARAGLSIAHAGVAFFLSALASAAGQERDSIAIATNDGQLARLALALRSAGLNPKEVEEQFLYIHPEISLPEGFSLLRGDRARELLAASQGWQAA